MPISSAGSTRGRRCFERRNRAEVANDARPLSSTETFQSKPLLQARSSVIRARYPPQGYTTVHSSPSAVFALSVTKRTEELCRLPAGISSRAPRHVEAGYIRCTEIALYETSTSRSKVTGDCKSLSGDGCAEYLYENRLLLLLSLANLLMDRAKGRKRRRSIVRDLLGFGLARNRYKLEYHCFACSEGYFLLSYLVWIGVDFYYSHEITRVKALFLVVLYRLTMQFSNVEICLSGVETD